MTTAYSQTSFYSSSTTQSDCSNHPFDGSSTSNDTHLLYLTFNELTVATATNPGVSTWPCGVWIRPTRAREILEAARTSNLKKEGVAARVEAILLLNNTRPWRWRRRWWLHSRPRFDFCLQSVVEIVVSSSSIRSQSLI